MFHLALTVCLLMAQDKAWGPEPPVAPYTAEMLPNQSVVVPIVFPLIGKCRWFDDYNVNRGNFRHTGIDIRAPKMTPIVAPFSGIIGVKVHTFWIYGDNGWAMLGTHLNDDTPGTNDGANARDYMFAPDIEPNGRVFAGQFIGYVGNSGDATAPHLHFEIYAPGTGRTAPRIRNPFFSLKAAQVLTAPKTDLPEPNAIPPAGQMRWLGCIRRIDEARSTVTLLLSAKQARNGKSQAIVHPAYRVFSLNPSLVTAVGGWSTLRRRSASTQLSIYASATAARRVRVER